MCRVDTSLLTWKLEPQVWNRMKSHEITLLHDPTRTKAIDQKAMGAECIETAVNPPMLCRTALRSPSNADAGSRAVIGRWKALKVVFSIRLLLASGRCGPYSFEAMQSNSHLRHRTLKVDDVGLPPRRHIGKFCLDSSPVQMQNRP